VRRRRISLGKYLLPIKFRANQLAWFGPFALLVVTIPFLQSCKRNPGTPPTGAQIRAISEELDSAVSSVAPPGTRVLLGSGASRIPTLQRPDSISILIENKLSIEAGRGNIARILQSIGAVATHNRLTQDDPVQTRDALRLTLRRSGVVTHEIEILFGVPKSTGPITSAPASKTPGPRLAIILDDLGGDPAAAEAIFALAYPLTVSVLPNHEHSVDIAKEAHRRGYQVMLHLPMQSIANEKPEARELHPGMPAGEVSTLVDQFLQNVPDVAGVNNHEGSQATSDPALMSELMPVLRDRHLFYIDSRTTAATVAYDSAQSAGVLSAFRNVPFLDDVVQVAAVRKQLELALRGAREKGEAIAIGHPHPATLQALREVLPQAQAQGVRLVFASELVH
jgi:uncharacterized protein